MAPLKKSIYYALPIFIALIITILASCSNHSTNQCLKDYIIEKPKTRHPSLVILNELNNDETSGCTYKIRIACSVFRNNYFPNAVFYKNRQKFYVQFKNPETRPFILFNLSSKVGEEKEFNIEPIHRKDEEKILKSNFSVVLEKKLKCGQQEVFVFRVKEFFNYYEGWPDIVYFVTSDSGVIGSYFSHFDKNGAEVYIAPAGNICKEQIDYSKKSEGKFM